MEKTRKESNELELEKIIKYVLSIKPEDFSAQLATTEYVPKREEKNWMDYMNSFNDYKSGILVANSHHFGQEERIRNIAKEYILSSLTLKRTVYPLICNKDNKISIDSLLFDEAYNLNISLESKNKIMLVIYNLLSIQATLGFKKGRDIAKFLFQALSSQNIDEDNTMHILIAYIKELIKTINEKEYNSQLIMQLQQAIMKRDEINKLKEVDTSIVGDIKSFSDTEKERFLLGIGQKNDEEIQKNYRRALEIIIK